MKLFSFNGLLWHLYTLSCFISVTCGQTWLPIKLDATIRENNGPVVYSVVVNFPPNGVDKDEQLAYAAQRAHQEMMKLPYGILKGDSPPVAERPKVMTALRVNNPKDPGGTTVYFASSMKHDHGTGQHSFMQKFVAQFPAEAMPLQGALHACQVAASGGYHRYDAHCGEPMALAAFYKTEPGADIRTRNPLMAAYDFDAQAIVAPCEPKRGDTQTYGCKQMLGQLGVRWVKASSKMEGITEGRRELSVQFEDVTGKEIAPHVGKHYPGEPFYLVNNLQMEGSSGKPGQLRVWDVVAPLGRGSEVEGI
ncbi:hypothetical protein BDV95DRAFT_595199 [Massariosphaeria phaeospora]|uniref:Uncharacterized protein n=1 Tax=Massariosphaeria phaeospora TaxID=100035 RepID=A0A7C8MDA9_9PLEO|nr:hypothetical protein BDV95DRAFT_595199 [Massariosphaeria phaeospora]